MMNRKSQAVAVREVFHFMAGVLLLIGVIELFNVIKPDVENFALAKQAGNVNTQLNYVFSQLLTVSDRLSEGSVTAFYAMPGQLGDYTYRVYFNATQVCTLVKGTILDCLYMSINSPTFSGLFSSGGDLKIVMNKTLDGTTVAISN